MSAVKLSPSELRDELVQMVTTDLRGPSSPQEQLPGLRTPVREWYLVGMLAPQGTSLDPSRSDGDDLVAGDDESGSPGRDDRPARAVLVPSSAGMTFAVDLSCASLDVTAAWGRYEKIPNPDPDAEDNHRRLWQRYPAGGSRPLELADGEIESFAVDASQPDVVVRGRCRRTEQCWLVTLFLVNAQAPKRRNVDERWLFQIELSASATGGESVFVGRRLALAQDVADTDSELRHLDLLYRNKVEFAAGHGVAVHADVDPDDPQRARRVSIATIPSSEVAKVEAPPPDDAAMHPTERELLSRVVLNMADLSRMDGPEASSVLRPLLGAYRHWLDRQRARVEGDVLADHRETAEAALSDANEIADRLDAGIRLIETHPLAAEAFAFANHAMWQQRLHSEVVTARRTNHDLTLEAAEIALDTAENHSWRPFQLAFMLLNLAVPVRAHPRRAPTRYRDSGSTVLPHRWGQDRGLPRVDRVHAGGAAAAGCRRGTLGRRWRRRADAVHTAPTDRSAVPARGDIDLCLRAPSPRTRGQGRRALERATVPGRALGRWSGHSESSIRCTKQPGCCWWQRLFESSQPRHACRVPMVRHDDRAAS